MPWKLFGIRHRDANSRAAGCPTTGLKNGKTRSSRTSLWYLANEVHEPGRPKDVLLQERRARLSAERHALLEESFKAVVAYLRIQLPPSELAVLDHLLVEREAQQAEQTQAGANGPKTADKKIAQIIAGMPRKNQRELEVLLMKAHLHPVQVACGTAHDLARTASHYL